MQVCPRCGAGDQRLRPGSVASGLYCGCGTRLIPENPTQQQLLSSEEQALAQGNEKLAQALTANRAIVKSLYDLRNQFNLKTIDLSTITAERDSLRAELAAIKAALAASGLPEPPTKAAAAPATPTRATGQVDFHGVPLTPQGTPEIAQQKKQ